jgi:EAL domain-containing protein (putative c-di-GMP-specific phosphodiesterase class I)
LRWTYAAIKDDVFEVYYQPLVNLATGEVRSLEALIRWPHPEHGMIPPSEFVPVAGEIGLIAQLGLFVLRRACADAARWPGDVKVAVNLSPMQFKSGNLLQALRDSLANAGLPPTRL